MNTGSLPQEEGCERRAAHRAPLGTKVNWQAAGEAQWHEDPSRDVSSAGMLLQTQVAVQPGTILKLQFRLPNLSFQDPITADAEVVRVVERRGRQTGLGLRFLTLKSRNYQVLHDFVCRILGLFPDGNMEGLAGPRVGDDYSFSMEQLLRENEARKMALLDKKQAAAEARRRRNVYLGFTRSAMKIALLGTGLYLVYLLFAFIRELFDKAN
jgi:hypothetical protein